MAAAYNVVKILLLLLLLFIARPAALWSTELKIAAAADLKFAFEELIQKFQAQHPKTKLIVSYGSSGNFYAQLQNRALFDLFFSADVDYPRKLVQANLALDGDVFIYAVGRIVIWLPTGSPLDVSTWGMQVLLDARIQKIAIANPRHAPYGIAAVAALKSLQIYEQVEPKLVYGENVAQAAQFVQSGAADAGIIALALAMAPPMRTKGVYWQVPLDSYPIMQQGAIITQWTSVPSLARLFIDFVLGTQGREVLKRYGFVLPQNPLLESAIQFD